MCVSEGRHEKGKETAQQRRPDDVPSKKFGWGQSPRDAAESKSQRRRGRRDQKKDIMQPKRQSGSRLSGQTRGVRATSQQQQQQPLGDKKRRRKYRRWAMVQPTDAMTDIGRLRRQTGNDEALQRRNAKRCRDKRQKKGGSIGRVVPLASATADAMKRWHGAEKKEIWEGIVILSGR